MATKEECSSKMFKNSIPWPCVSIIKFKIHRHQQTSIKKALDLVPKYQMSFIVF